MSFRREAIAFIKHRAAQAAGAREIELIRLAAYLFAIGSQLQLNHGTPRLLVRAEPPEPWTSKDRLFKELAEIPEDLDAARLFWTLIGALKTIESLLWRQPSYRTALPASTLLEGFPEGSFRGLGGRVLHWIRPQSTLNSERERRFQQAVKRPPDPAPHPGIYLRRLALYWDSDVQLPKVVPVKPDSRTRRFFDRSGSDLSERKRFRVALCPLRGSFHPRFQIDPEGRHFQALATGAMAQRAELHQHLSSLVEEAVAEGVDLIVLPELMVDLAARDHLRSLLQQRLKPGGSLPFGTVAGSFHVPAEPSGDERLPVNEAVLLDPAGEIAARHWKKGRFRIPSSQVKSAPHFFPHPPAKVQREIFEDIHYGSELRILDTSLGRLAFLICADAIAADDKGYLPVVRHLRPDLLIIVSMTPETPPFDAFAEEMGRYWIGTLFVNAHCVCGGKPAGFLRGAVAHFLNSLRDRLGLRTSIPNLAACDLALHEPAGTPSTRLRWRYGKDEAECIYHQPADGNRRWRPLSKALGKTGVSWLVSGTETLGLIIDLGVHWLFPDERGEETERKQ